LECHGVGNDPIAFGLELVVVFQPPVGNYWYRSFFAAMVARNSRREMVAKTEINGGLKAL
jgi:hypothetical protein